MTPNFPLFEQPYPKCYFASYFSHEKSLSKQILSTWVFQSLAHFSPVSHFYNPRKRQKTKGFLTFSGDIEM